MLVTPKIISINGIYAGEFIRQGNVVASFFLHFTKPVRSGTNQYNSFLDK